MGRGDSSTSEHGREPCPDRILDDMGGAFAMGAVGGGMWHLVKGLRNSPSGYRIRGALESVRRESPRMGGGFANWGLSFSCFDCMLQYVRKKEDPWNAIGAGALTGGFLQLRHGLRSAGKSALFGGFILALIEGVNISLSKSLSPPPPGVPYQAPVEASGPSSTLPSGSELTSDGGSSSKGSFWSFFGSNTTEPAAAKEQTFSDDYQPPAMPDFSVDQFKTDPGFKS